jgi:hypothetical protein
MKLPDLNCLFCAVMSGGILSESGCEGFIHMTRMGIGPTYIEKDNKNFRFGGQRHPFKRKVIFYTSKWFFKYTVLLYKTQL